MKKEKISLVEYLQIRNEANVATIIFILYTVIFAAAGFYLVSQGARYYTYLSLGMAIYMVIGLYVFVPPFHAKVHLEIAQPELKTYSSKEVPLSSNFILKQAVAYGVAIVILGMIFGNALSAVQEKVDLPPSLPSVSEIEESTTVPSIDFSTEHSENN